MRQYLLRRLLFSFVTLFGVSLLTFSLIRLVPGDVIMATIQDAGSVDRNQLAAIRAQLGLDRPAHVQYLTWAGGVVHGDFGRSLFTSRPITPELLRKIPVTLELTVLSMLLAIVIAVPIGVLAAARRDTAPDLLGRLFVIGGLSFPDFWLATLFVVYAAVVWHYSAPAGYTPPWVDLTRNLQQFGPPSIILGLRLSAISMRMTRSQMLEVLSEDYIRTAWSKGLRERIVVFRHALKNALIPVVTVFGSQFGRLLGGTVVIETIFALPGMGRFVFDGVMSRDYPVVQGAVLFIAAVIVIMNFLVDLTYAWLDPRIRYR